MNFVMITGNVATEPEAYTTQNGISRSSFKVAVQRRYKNAEGKHDADFFPVVAWRGTADFCNRYVKKGRKVAITGNLQTRSYDGKDGNKHYITEINVDSIETLDKPDGDRPANRQQNAPEPPAPNDFQEVDAGDDLPFER